MDNRTAPTPIVGQLVEIPENGYLYGSGRLVLRVTAVRPAPDLGWIEVTGQEIGWDGTRIGARSVVALRSAIALVRHPA